MAGKGGKGGKGGKFGSVKSKKPFQSRSTKAGLQVIYLYNNYLNIQQNTIDLPLFLFVSSLSEEFIDS